MIVSIGVVTVDGVETVKSPAAHQQFIDAIAVDIRKLNRLIVGQCSRAIDGFHGAKPSLTQIFFVVEYTRLAGENTRRTLTDQVDPLVITLVQTRRQIGQAITVDVFNALFRLRDGIVKFHRWHSFDYITIITVAAVATRLIAGQASAGEKGQ